MQVLKETASTIIYKDEKGRINYRFKGQPIEAEL